MSLQTIGPCHSCVGWYINPDPESFISWGDGGEGEGSLATIWTLSLMCGVVHKSRSRKFHQWGGWGRGRGGLWQLFGPCHSCVAWYISPDPEIFISGGMGERERGLWQLFGPCHSCVAWYISPDPEIFISGGMGERERGSLATIGTLSLMCGVVHKSRSRNFHQWGDRGEGEGVFGNNWDPVTHVWRGT